MRITPIVGYTNNLTKMATRSMYEVRLQNAKQNLTRDMYVQQIERDYMQRNIRPC